MGKKKEHGFINRIAAAKQRARLLVNGVAGILGEKQRALALDLLVELEQIEKEVNELYEPREVKIETFDLSALCAEVAGALRFLAHRKNITAYLVGTKYPFPCVADREVIREALLQGMSSALNGAEHNSRMTVELTRSEDNAMVYISAIGWKKYLPPTPLAGSGVAVSTTNTSIGTRLVISAGIK